MDTPELDRAIVVAQERVFNNQERVVDPLDRTYARALIRELFTNLQPPAEILRAAGLEGEG